jgi:hypothetical protein
MFGKDGAQIKTLRRPLIALAAAAPPRMLDLKAATKAAGQGRTR